MRKPPRRRHLISGIRVHSVLVESVAVHGLVVSFLFFLLASSMEHNSYFLTDIPTLNFYLYKSNILAIAVYLYSHQYVHAAEAACRY